MMFDPVRTAEMWQATCDDCGWHTPPASPESVVREWARLHRVTCPLKTGRGSDEVDQAQP
jgi:hypothetical protein